MDYWGDQVSRHGLIKSKLARLRGRQSERRYRVESNKKTDLKCPAITKLIMNRRRKMERGMRNTGEAERLCVGGKPKRLTVLFKYWEVRGYKDFFPGRNCKPFACKRNYFVLQSETTTYACWRKRNVECCYTPEWHLSVRVLISLMSAHKRTLMDRGLPLTL